MSPYIHRLIAAAVAIYIGGAIGLYFRVPALIQERLAQTSQTR